MTFSRLLGTTLLAAVFLSLLPTAQASPQKISNKYRKFPNLGLEFKSLKDLSDVPVNDRMKSLQVIAQGSTERGPFVKTEDGERFSYTPSLYVFYDEPQGPLTGGGNKKRQSRSGKPAEARDYPVLVLGGLNLDNVEPEVEEFKSFKKIDGQLSRFETMYRTAYGRVEVYVDVYTFFIGQSKLVFVWDYPCAEKKHRNKWGKVIEKSMNSLRYMRSGSDEIDLKEVNSESSYEDLLAYHQHDVDQTPGWDLIETPSKQYLIKTNSEDRKDLKSVIKRLEASRRLFEEDFPPHRPITSISVVRICNTREEFNTYGQTGGGVAGYFNPGSEELVLFFGDGSIHMTLGVMTHEAFHQYCHFLFDRSEAHRWFDEGHGDYYGAWTLKGKNLKPARDMKGGLSRVPHLKELFRNDQLASLSRHIRFNHSQWQRQGPQNISNYCQSFGLIYFLREGARRKVPSRYWKEEYATIIPNYMKYLNEGYQASYDEIIAKAKKDLEALGEPGKKDDEDQRKRLKERINNPWDSFRSFGDKEAIWDRAMEESWGKIDEKEFEERWLKYIDKEI